MRGFGQVSGNAGIAPGESGCAFIERSPLGNIIQNAIRQLPEEFPIIQLYQYCVMPDHVHILLRVLNRSEKHLGFYITMLKGKIREKYSLLTGREISSEEIFKPNYCDKPLICRRSLDGLFRYIRENPHRLAMRRQYPGFFQRVRKLKIGNREYEAYGNLFLFRNPTRKPLGRVAVLLKMRKSGKRLIGSLWPHRAQCWSLLSYRLRRNR